MKTKNDRPVRALALCALALAGCDSVKDVRTEPFTPLPSDRVVLKGLINGLGGGRAITLAFNGDSTKDIGLVGADPAFPTDAPESVPFSFGSLVEGTAYNVVVKGQPFGKNCVPVSGNSGTLVKGEETNVVINCVPDIPRRDLTVQIPPTPSLFSGLKGAKVVLYTGEWMQQRNITPGQTSVTFDDALFSATVEVTNPNGTISNVAAGTELRYTVSASFIDDDGNESRCLVTNATGANPLPTTTNPSGNVTNVIVGDPLTPTAPACTFKMAGSVAYSAPPGGIAETGAIPGGMLLEVRDLQGVEKTTYEVNAYGAFTIGGATPTQFSSNIKSNFDIVVKRQPTGRTCVVGDGGAASFYRTGILNPTNIAATAAVATAPVPPFTPGTMAWGSRLNVFCRALPATGSALTGTYRLTSSTWKAAPTTAIPNPSAITIRYNNYDWTRQNLGSSNMLTFFEDGTFLYGTHGHVSGTLPDGSNASPFSVQVEHGFYEYNPGAGTLRFTLITDTNPTTAFPSGYAAADNLVWSAARAGTPGLSAAPAPIMNPAIPLTAGAGIGALTAAMTSVQKTAVMFNEGRNPSQMLSRITGTFGGATPTAARLDWELTEPQSLAGEMTGTWTSQDHRRFWVWDYLNYYGTHVGVAGGAPAMNDACFTVAEVEAPFGIYTRRGTSTGCYPFNRPARDAAYLFGFVESADFHLTDSTVSTNTFSGVANLGTATGANVANSRLAPQFGTTALAVLPGFVGRMPGGQSAADGRSPSPVVYKIAPASTFASSVASTFYADIGQPASRYFDDLAAVGPFTWCPTEILAVRATQNAEPINKAIYFCRNRAP